MANIADEVLLSNADSYRQAIISLRRKRNRREGMKLETCSSYQMVCSVSRGILAFPQSKQDIIKQPSTEDVM